MGTPPLLSEKRGNMKRTTGISHGLLTLFLAILFAALSSSCGGGGGGESGHGLPVTMTVKASAVSPSQIALSWTPATLVTDYRIYMNGAYSGTVYPSQGTSITVSGLNPSTRHCFVVYVYVFAIGATEQSNEACATTLPNSPPTAPSNLTANGVSPAQVDLTWTASTDDYGVAGYQIYRNGTNITSVPGTSASDTGLDPGASYCYAVTAYDFGYAAGRFAPAETPIQVNVSTDGTITHGKNVAIVRPSASAAGYLPPQIESFTHSRRSDRDDRH